MLAAVLLSFVSPAVEARPVAERCVGRCRADLDAARATTAKYQDVRVALDDGFLPFPPCEAGASGAAMGIHYAQPDLFDETVAVTEPEILLYVPDREGAMRLVGIEYSVPVFRNGQAYSGDEPPPAEEINPAPVMFGRSFDGPMPGHNPLQSWHYDLHVWAWSANPAGLFAHYNPYEDCAP